MATVEASLSVLMLTYYDDVWFVWAGFAVVFSLSLYLFVCPIVSGGLRIMATPSSRTKKRGWPRGARP